MEIPSIKKNCLNIWSLILLSTILLMKNIETISWFVWLLFVILWNYGYPAASPFLDVLVAVILSIANIMLLKVIKK